MSLIEKIKAELEWLGVEFFSLSYEVQTQCSSTSEEDQELDVNRKRAERAIADAQAALTAIMDAGDGAQEVDRQLADDMRVDAIKLRLGEVGPSRVIKERQLLAARHRSTAAAAERAGRDKIATAMREEADRLSASGDMAFTLRKWADAIERGGEV